MFNINEKAATNAVWNMIKELSTKKGITEIIINQLNTVFIERAGEFIQLNVKFDRFDIDTFIQDVADYNSRIFDETHPILDGRLPDGSRINVISDQFAQSCPAITIRKYLKGIKSFDTSEGIFGLDQKWVKVLRGLVDARMNIVVSGGTGVGKTTFLNLLMQEVSPAQRVVTIEDTRELSFNLPNVVRLESNIGQGEGAQLNIRALLKNSLRMRPDRIVVGEVRGEETFDLLQAMNTGHDGTMASIHANSTGECLHRIETLYMLSGFDIPIKAIRQQICTAVDFIIQLGRDKDGNRTLIQLTELSNMENDRITMQDIGKLVNGELKLTGLVPQRIKDLMDVGVNSTDFEN